MKEVLALWSDVCMHWIFYIFESRAFIRRGRRLRKVTVKTLDCCRHLKSFPVHLLYWYMTGNDRTYRLGARSITVRIAEFWINFLVVKMSTVSYTSIFRD